ncbi:MAG: M48 family metalloprotease [Asgard group archaeon]|nr:M48 family metalloprotease [Asgard group archaeon]
MAINKTLAEAQLKMHLTTITFFLLNIFHIILASTASINTQSEGIIRFEVRFFSTFNVPTLIIALVLFVVQIIISYLALIRQFKQSGLVQINELGIIGENHASITKNLRIDPKIIYRWTIEQAEEQKIKSIKRVYLTDTSIPNAMTLDIVPLPLVRCTWIVLDANVLEILDEREIKAVIAHELGHIKYFDSIINIFRYGINYFVYIAYSWFLLRLIFYLIRGEPDAINITLQIAFVLVFILILAGLTIINRILLNYSRRQAELMADYYAAKKVGRNYIINALILLGQRLDVINAFGMEFKWLGSRENRNDVSKEFLLGLKNLPPEELSTKISRERAVNIYVHQRLQSLKDDLCVPLTDEEIKDLTNQASIKLLSLREEQLQNGSLKDRKIKSEMLKLTIDWLGVDQNKDQYLEDEEIDTLIKTILRNPNKELFEHDVYNKLPIFSRNHPSMKDRILFLYYTHKNTNKQNKIETES